MPVLVTTAATDALIAATCNLDSLTILVQLLLLLLLLLRCRIPAGFMYTCVHMDVARAIHAGRRCCCYCIAGERQLGERGMKL